MFELSFNLPNLYFLDTHFALASDRISERMENVIPRNDSRGVHITWEARRLITEHIINAVELVRCISLNKPVGRRLSQWQWPLRAVYKFSYREFNGC